MSFSVCRDGALLVLSGQHLAPAERPIAWLGSHKPSEAAAAIAAALLANAQLELKRLQVRSLNSQTDRGTCCSVTEGCFDGSRGVPQMRVEVLMATLPCNDEW